MRRILPLMAGVCLFIAAFAFDGASLGAADSPRLIVTLVVDQMRADYLQVFNKHWRGGFRTLQRDGVRERSLPISRHRDLRRPRDHWHRRAAASPRDDQQHVVGAEGTNADWMLQRSGDDRHHVWPSNSTREQRCSPVGTDAR